MYAVIGAPLEMRGFPSWGLHQDPTSFIAVVRLPCPLVYTGDDQWAETPTRGSRYGDESKPEGYA